MNIYGINNHKISTNLVDNNKILINIVNPKNDIYESITHISDLNSIFGYNDTYNIIVECFKKTPNYILTTAFKNDIYYLKFQTNFNIYQMTFLIKVEKKNKYENKISYLDENVREIINNLDYMNIEFTRTNLSKSTINLLKKIIDKEKKSEVKENTMNLSEQNVDKSSDKFIVDSGNITKENTVNIYIPLLSTNVVLCHISDTYKIKLLYKLEKLVITTNSKSLDFQNNNLKTLTLIAPNIETLKGINKFPNLETLELDSCSMLYDIKSYISNTKINKLIFRKCGENQKRNMTSYCNAKNIDLSYV